MRHFLFIIFWFLGLQVQAQVQCSASASSGSGYGAIISAGFEIEDPDCEHSNFGPHITQAYDELLERNVFVFHSHIDEDNDRCEVFDRVRMEIKGGPNSAEELKHPEGSTSYYRWKFMLVSDFVGSSSFCHIFQDKIVGGDDTAFPIITITPRKDIVEVLHNGGNTGEDLGRVASAPLDQFKGRWIEGYIKQVHAENGFFEIVLKDMVSGKVLIEYSNSNIDMWRTGAEYARPKWGMYRSKRTDIKDETILFADFCVSETSEAFCPADTFQIKDKQAPSIPTGLVATDIMIKSATLNWDASTDNIGVSSYKLYQDGVEVYNGLDLFATVSLVGSTTYEFSVTALDDAGNESAPSTSLTVTTDDANALPDAATRPVPSNASVNVSTDITLTWAKGKNTDSYQVYFGQTGEPVLVSSQVDVGYSPPPLEVNTTYYWQVGAVNDNGEVKSPVWSFITGSGNNDFPWKVYRANERLDKEADFFSLLDIPTAPTLDLVQDDTANPDNRIYSYHEAGDEKFRWRSTIDPQDTAITIVARFKALSEDVNCICYFEVKAFGWREKVRVNQSTVKLERSSPVVENSLPFDIVKDFHILRMTMKGNQSYIYLDEDPTPFAIGSSATTDTGFNFEWGKSGSNECGGTIDWLTILDNEAYAPGEGPKLPSDLIPFNTGAQVNPPANLRSSNVSTNSATISWDQAISDLDVADYTLYLDGVAFWTGESTSTEVIDLMPFNTYAFTVTTRDVADNVSDPSATLVVTTTADDGDWKVFRGNADLNTETSFWTLKDVPMAPSFNEITNDPNGSGNNFYTYGELTEEKFRWRYSFDSQDTAITIVARVKAVNEDLLCLAYFEVYGFGWREKVRLNQNSVKLEKSDPVVETNLPFDINKNFHILRMVMKGQETAIYLDENPAPVAVGRSGETKTGSFFEFGKSGSNECGCQIDWMTIYKNSAYAPGEGPNLPSDLFLSSDASLASLAINGVQVSNFNPDSLSYTYDINGLTTIPQVTFTTTSPLATVALTNPNSVPNTVATILVMAQDGFTKQTYEILYEGIVGTSELDINLFKIYPNPTHNKLAVELKEALDVTVSVIDMSGKEILKSSGYQAVLLNLEEVQAGTYLIKVVDAVGQLVYRKIIIQ